MKKFEVYSVKGGKVERKRKPCPRCGAGVFLAEHKGRLFCGSCHYTEFLKGGEKQEVKPAKQEKPKEEKKQ